MQGQAHVLLGRDASHADRIKKVRVIEALLVQDITQNQLVTYSERGLGYLD